MKIKILFLLVILIAGILGIIIVIRGRSAGIKEVSSFEECARLGYPIAESYPRQCMADGKVFVETAQVSKNYGAENPIERKIVEIIKNDISDRLAIAEDEILVMDIRKAEWPNSCLGIPDRGNMCAQVITTGYEVTLQAKNKVYVYRTDEDGSIVKLQPQDVGEFRISY
jgi:hypothetical protein